jgi:brefeldin A-inhibited guanine nucleotide-exchange protein
MIGDYLGEDETLNKKVLYDFVDLHDFKDMQFVNALRHFLSSFRLPGEA